MMQQAVSGAIPPSVDRVLRLFRSMGREEKMQSLVQYSKKLEPLPERYRDLDRGEFNVPECQTRVDIIPEVVDGRLHFYADLNARQSPTIAAVLAIVFSAVNDQPPSTTLAIPSDFVRTLMESIGLGAREPGLNAMITRLKRYAAAVQAGLDITPHPEAHG
jgi:cysteine desulfuration protein SufE